MINVGLRRDRLDVSCHPSTRRTAPPTSREWDGAETPDPAPGVPRPLGYPITVAFARYQRGRVGRRRARDAAGTPLEISTPRTDWMRAAAIIPHRPLTPGEGYTARVEATVDDATVTKYWSFTTARDCAKRWRTPDV